MTIHTASIHIAITAAAGNPLSFILCIPLDANVQQNIPDHGLTLGTNLIVIFIDAAETSKNIRIVWVVAL
jgi:hypothetical protein